MERGTNSLIGVGAAARCGADDRAHRGVEIGAPGGSEAAGDLAIGGGGPEFVLAGVVIGGDLGVVEKGEEVLAQLAVALSQSLAVPVGGSGQPAGAPRP